MRIKKVASVINSCTSNNQLIVAIQYVELFMNKYVKYHNLSSSTEKTFLMHVSSLLTSKSREVCNENQATYFHIYLNSNKSRHSKRFCHILTNYNHIPIEDRIKREEYL